MNREGEKPIGEILRELAEDITGILRAEFKLLKTEVRDEVVQISRAAPMLAIGAVFGLCSLGVLMAAIILLLGTWIPYWGAALCVFGATAVIAGSCFLLGRLALQTLKPPVRTIATIKENAEWLSSHVK